MTERSKPYIGISGVVNPNQQYYLLDQFAWQGLEVKRLLALGVKAVHKTQFLDVENKYGPEWFPVGEDAFAGALEPSGGDFLRVAQIYFDADSIDDADYRNKFMQRICRRGAAWLNAVQFDMLPWHSDAIYLEFIEQIKTETGLKVLLQAHGEAMKDLGPSGIVQKLGQYASSVDYILFDASHGKGLKLDTSALRPFLEAAYSSEQLSPTSISIAGGLNATIVHEDLPELLTDFPDVSWDAEGQLHPANEYGKRPINMQVAKQYLAASADILQRV